MTTHIPTGDIKLTDACAQSLIHDKGMQRDPRNATLVTKMMN